MALFGRRRRAEVAVIPSHPVRLAESRSASPALAPVGVTGVAHFAGIVYDQDYDLAWQGIERDRTVQRMLNDPLIGSALLGVEMLLRRVDWSLEPADTPKGEACAEFVDECLADMVGFWPGETLARVLTYLGWGWSALEVVHKRRADGRIGWDEWRLIPQFTRFGWEFDARGNASTLIQTDPQTYRQIPIPLDRCLIIRYGARDNSPEGSTPLRICWDAYYKKAKLEVIEGIGAERDLAGLPVMRIPAQDIQNRTPVYEMAQQIVTGIRNDSEAGVLLASDRDAHGEFEQTLELLSTGGSRMYDTDTIIRRYSNEVVTVFLANVMRTGQDGTGSYSLADTQSGLFQQATGAHLDTIADAINGQPIPRLIELNPEFAAEDAPKLKHGDIESSDLEQLGAYLINMANAGMLVDTPELRAFVHEVAGLPVPGLDELKRLAEEEEKRRKAATASLALANKAAAEQANAPTAEATAENSTAPSATSPPSPAKLAEVRRLIEDDGTLTLADMLEVVAAFDAAVGEEYAGLLNAVILPDESDPAEVG